MNIRPAEPRDIPSLVALERTSDRAAHWSEEHYTQAVRAESDIAERLFLVAEATSSNPQNETAGVARIVAFLVARHLAPEWELENIVVSADTRRNGIGAKLLAMLMARARETNSTAVFLEVRESNLAGRALYEKAGFRESGRRKSYYNNPLEDAVLYTCSITQGVSL